MINRIVFLMSYFNIPHNKRYFLLKKISEEKLYSDKKLSILFNKKIELISSINEHFIDDYLSVHDVKIVTIFDEFYPKKLKNIYNPPLMLFYRGNLKLAYQKSLAIIGSRKHTEYGKNVTHYFVEELVKKNFIIISGLAYGIDSISHAKCLQSGGKTIAVLGSGLSKIYPNKHYDLAQEIGSKGLLISEYPPHFSPSREYFPMRNRIVSGLSDGVLIVEGSKNSGTLITSEFALEQGKNIYAIPGNIFSQNSYVPNMLSNEGAKIVIKSSDIFEDF